MSADKRCMYSDCGESLLEDAYVNPWGGHYCNQRCAILDLIEKSLKQLRDPQLQRVPELRRIGEAALLEAYEFALDVTIDPLPTERPEEEDN